MGWGTSFLKSIYLNRQTYTSVYQVEDEIQEIESEIERIKSRIKMYASANIKDLVSIELNDDPIFTTEVKVDLLLNEYQENLNKLKDLIYYKEYLKEKETKFRELKMELKNSVRIIFTKKLPFIGFGKGVIVIKLK